MPRQARLDAPGALHHVMIQGIERSPIFEADRDGQDFILRIGMLRSFPSVLIDKTTSIKIS